MSALWWSWRQRYAEYAPPAGTFIRPWQCLWHCENPTECENEDATICVNRLQYSWQWYKMTSLLWVDGDIRILWLRIAKREGEALTSSLPKMDATLLANLCQRKVSKTWTSKVFLECWLPDAYNDSWQSGRTHFELDTKCKLQLEVGRKTKSIFSQPPRLCH